MSEEEEERAVQKINGTFVGTARVEVKMADFQRNNHKEEGNFKGRRTDGKDETSVKQNNDEGTCYGGAWEGFGSAPGRKSIKVLPDPTQVDILKRSVVVKSINTIRSGWIKEQIAKF
ncbi:hypothetical protein PIB30_056710 [Stylosanthes scabra]|uniref:RRM domain-containing protein n=1 Tax=Stylosanthes scabra TaxID=79078 RepID=A0ABU6ULG6_9FABA|nr:hypothetical protein [Stylosanthes scabra]